MTAVNLDLKLAVLLCLLYSSRIPVDPEDVFLERLGDAATDIERPPPTAVEEDPSCFGEGCWLPPTLLYSRES